MYHACMLARNLSCIFMSGVPVQTKMTVAYPVEEHRQWACNAPKLLCACPHSGCDTLEGPSASSIQALLRNDTSMRIVSDNITSVVLVAESMDAVRAIAERLRDQGSYGAMPTSGTGPLRSPHAADAALSHLGAVAAGQA